MSKPGDDTNLWKSLFHFCGHSLGSDSQCQSSSQTGVSEELSSAPPPLLQHVLNETSMDLPEQLEQDGEHLLSQSPPCASNFSFLPPYAGVSWSFHSNVAGKWEKSVRSPGWRPDCTLFSADSSPYPEAQRVDICAEIKPCQEGMFCEASELVCNIFSFFFFFYPL